MSKVKHDYSGALKVLENYIEQNTKTSSLLSHVEITNAKKTIIHALKLAAVVTGEPTVSMCDEGEITAIELAGDDLYLAESAPDSEDCGYIFKAMIAQAEKGIG